MMITEECSAKILMIPGLPGPCRMSSSENVLSVYKYYLILIIKKTDVSMQYH